MTDVTVAEQLCSWPLDDEQGADTANRGGAVEASLSTVQRVSPAPT